MLTARQADSAPEPPAKSLSAQEFGEAMSRVSILLENTANIFLPIKRQEDYLALMSLPKTSPVRQYFERNMKTWSLGARSLLLSEEDKASLHQLNQEVLRHKRKRTAPCQPDSQQH